MVPFSHWSWHAPCWSLWGGRVIQLKAPPQSSPPGPTHYIQQPLNTCCCHTHKHWSLQFSTVFPEMWNHWDFRFMTIDQASTCMGGGGQWGSSWLGKKQKAAQVVCHGALPIIRSAFRACSQKSPLTSLKASWKGRVHQKVR